MKTINVIAVAVGLSAVATMPLARAEFVAAPLPQGVPELLVTAAGKRVTTVAEWERVRRPELMKTFMEEEYGVRPAERPADLKFAETAAPEECFGGKAIRKRVRATY